MRTGIVTTFEPDRGLGEVATDDGTRYPFHCIAITDGSRAIEVGTRVRFSLHPKLGRVEASAIEPVGTA